MSEHIIDADAQQATTGEQQPGPGQPAPEGERSFAEDDDYFEPDEECLQDEGDGLNWVDVREDNGNDERIWEYVAEVPGGRYVVEVSEPEALLLDIRAYFTSRDAGSVSLFAFSSATDIEGIGRLWHQLDACPQYRSAIANELWRLKDVNYQGAFLACERHRSGEQGAPVAPLLEVAPAIQDIIRQLEYPTAIGLNGVFRSCSLTWMARAPGGWYRTKELPWGRYWEWIPDDGEAVTSGCHVPEGEPGHAEAVEALHDRLVFQVVDQETETRNLAQYRQHRS